jgi:hypothetical protein
MPLKKVTRAWEAAFAVEAASVRAERAPEVSAQETNVARESAIANVRDAKDQATLAEREARERVSMMEAESAVALASAHGEAEDRAQRVALLEGELAEGASLEMRPRRNPGA